MGLVFETYPGEDGLVRKAKIKTAASVYDRPIHKLCLIAIKEELNSMLQSYNPVKTNLCSAKKQVAQPITLVIRFPHWGGSVLYSAHSRRYCVNYLVFIQSLEDIFGYISGIRHEDRVEMDQVF